VLSQQVRELLEKSKKKRSRSGYIVQKYIERPFLVHGRKFDIRCFLLLVASGSSSSNGGGGGGGGAGLRAYVHLDG
jgi:hypothetical protein